jgi:putative nucleotidyltransferase with HDIG domain
MYSPEEQIVSLQQAVARLGFQGLRNIVLTVTMRTKVFDVPGFETRIRNLWIHSAIAAAWAREIARLRRTNVESAFLCGLLHDVGKPVVLQEFVSLAAALGEPLPRGLSREWMTEFHELVGRKLVERWKLLPSVVDAVSHHHHPETARSHRDAALTTCLADMLAHWTVDPSPQRTELLRGHEVPVALGLYVEDVNNLLRRGEGVLRSAKGLM